VARLPWVCFLDQTVHEQTPRGAKPFRGIHDIPRQRMRATIAAEI
jgi:hypothetical protein